MKSLRLATRLHLLIGSLCLLLAGVGGLGLYGISRSDEALRTVYQDRTLAAAELATIHRLIQSNLIDVAVAVSTPERIAAAATAVEGRIGAVSQAWEAYNATYLTEREKDMARQFAAARQSFVTEGLGATMNALRANELDKARQLLSAKALPLFDAMDKALTPLVALQGDEAKAEYLASVARFELLRMLAIGAVAGGRGQGLRLGLVRAEERGAGEERSRPGRPRRAQRQ